MERTKKTYMPPHMSLAQVQEQKKSVIFPDDADRLLNIAEAAARLRTSPSIISRFIKSGMLRGLHFGRRTGIRKTTLNAFLEQYDGKDVLAILEDREKDMEKAAR